MLAIALAELIDRHDAGMIELGRRRSLGMKALDFILGSQVPAEDHFQGDQAVELLVPGLVDLAHAATGDAREQLVVAKHARQRAGAAGLSGTAFPPNGGGRITET